MRDRRIVELPTSGSIGTVYVRAEAIEAVWRYGGRVDGSRVRVRSGIEFITTLSVEDTLDRWMAALEAESWRVVTS